MALNPSIILQGRGPDVLGAMGQGNALAQQTFDMQRQGDMQRLYREQGAGIASGDPTAINALAGMDPMAAMGVQRDRLNMDIARRNDSRADQQLQMQRDQQGRQAQMQDREWQFRMQEYARGLSAEDAAAQAAQVEDAVKMGMGIQDAQTWDQMMAQQAPELVGQFDQRDALAQRYMSVAEILKQQAGGLGSGDYGLNPVYGRDAEGNVVVMQLGKDGRAVQTAIPEGVTPDLAVRSQEQARGTEIGKQTGEAQMTLGGVVETAQRAIQNAVAIRDDPALPSITGMVQGRLPPMSQAGTDLNVRIQQAQGQVFLEAFDALKGGGAITETEGTKAEQAMARLNRAQSPEAYQEALNELIGIMETGVRRAQSRAGQQPSAGAQAITDMSDEDLIRMYGN